jgi:flagellar basal body-associated protein FliL
MKKKLIYIIAATVIVVAAIVAYSSLGGSNPAAEDSLKRKQGELKINVNATLVHASRLKANLSQPAPF